MDDALEEFQKDSDDKRRASWQSPEPSAQADFVPASLASFVAQAKATLTDAQKSLKSEFMTSPNGKQAEDDLDEFQKKTPKMLEDDEDKRLKREVLDKLQREQQGRQLLFSPTESDLASPAVMENPAANLTPNAAKQMALTSPTGFLPKQRDSVLETPDSFKTPQEQDSSSFVSMDPNVSVMMEPTPSNKAQTSLLDTDSPNNEPVSTKSLLDDDDDDSATSPQNLLDVAEASSEPLILSESMSVTSPALPPEVFENMMGYSPPPQEETTPVLVESTSLSPLVVAAKQDEATPIKRDEATPVKQQKETLILSESMSVSSTPAKTKREEKAPSPSFWSAALSGASPPTTKAVMSPAVSHVEATKSPPVAKKEYPVSTPVQPAVSTEVTSVGATPKTQTPLVVTKSMSATPSPAAKLVVPKVMAKSPAASVGSNVSPKKDEKTMSVPAKVEPVSKPTAVATVGSTDDSKKKKEPPVLSATPAKVTSEVPVGAESPAAALPKEKQPLVSKTLVTVSSSPAKIEPVPKPTAVATVGSTDESPKKKEQREPLVFSATPTKVTSEVDAESPAVASPKEKETPLVMSESKSATLMPAKVEPKSPAAASKKKEEKPLVLSGFKGTTSTPAKIAQKVAAASPIRTSVGSAVGKKREEESSLEPMSASKAVASPTGVLPSTPATPAPRATAHFPVVPSGSAALSKKEKEAKPVEPKPKSSSVATPQSLPKATATGQQPAAPMSVKKAPIASSSKQRASSRKVAPLPSPKPVQQSPKPSSAPPAEEGKCVTKSPAPEPGASPGQSVRSVQSRPRMVTTSPSNSPAKKATPSTSAKQTPASRTGFFERLSQPRKKVVIDAPESPKASGQMPATPASSARKTPSSKADTPISSTSNVTPRSAGRQRAFFDRLSRPKQTPAKSPANKKENSTVPSMVVVHGKEESVFSPLDPSSRESESSVPAASAVVEKEESANSLSASAPAMSEEVKVPTEADDAQFLPSGPTKSHSVLPPAQKLDKPAPLPTAVPIEENLIDDDFLPNKQSVLEKPVMKKPVSKVSKKPVTSSKVTKSTARGSTGRAEAAPAPAPVKPTTKPSSRSTRHFMQSTSSSANREGRVVSASHKTHAPNDGVAKARERIRQRKRLEEKKKAQREAEEHKKVPKRGDRVGSVDEGLARAKQRVRQRQLQADSRRTEAARNRKTASQGSTASTVPKSPALATKRLYGQKKYSTTGREAGSTRDVNPITRALGSPTHADHPKEVKKPSPAGSSRKFLTIPKGPRLSTSAKYGEKLTPTVKEKRAPVSKATPGQRSPVNKPKLTTPVPFHFHDSKRHAPVLATKAKSEPTLAESVDVLKKGLRQSTPVSSTSKPHLTKPVPFHFHESKSHAPRPSKTKSEPTLAESVDVLRKGLRQSAPASTTRHEKKLTRPKSPKFTKMPRRALPKSTAEKEKELVAYYKSHPFKAAPIMHTSSTSRGHSGVPKVQKRALTTPAAPRLRTVERGLHAKPPVGSPDPAIKDAKEMKKQFHARPLPNLSYKSPAVSSSSARKSLTRPKPFHLASDARAAKSESHIVSTDEVEMSKQFRARPLPLSTFQPPSPVSRASAGLGAPVDTKPERRAIRPPSLASEAQAVKRHAALEASRNNADSMTRQKERLRQQLQKKKHNEEIAKVTQKPVPTRIKSFHLESAVRHENYQHDFQAERIHQEEEEKQARCFHAQPLIFSPPPAKIKSRRHLTEPEPFHLQSMNRHEAAQRDLQEQRQAQEEERKQMSVRKARPVPKGIYKYKPITPKPPKKLVEPFSPQLQSKKRAAERSEFDAHVAQERGAELALQKAMEEQRAAEEEEDLQERRRLPVSEGGLMQQAQPINAVFMGTPGEMQGLN